jgi:hypothetical protein
VCVYVVSWCCILKEIEDLGREGVGEKVVKSVQSSCNGTAKEPGVDSRVRLLREPTV